MSTPTIATAPPRGYPSLRAAAVPLAALCLAFFVEMVDNTLLVDRPADDRPRARRRHDRRCSG